MQFTVRVFGLEMLHMELCDPVEGERDNGYLGSNPVGFVASPGDQRWEKGARPRMTTFDNAEPQPDWAPDCRCGVCHTCLPAMRIPESIVLGEN